MFPSHQIDPRIDKLNESYGTIINILVNANDLDIAFIKVKYKMTKRKSELIDNVSSLVRTLEKIGECNALDKFHTVEFLSVFVNNSVLKDLVTKHRRLLDNTDFESYLLINKYVAKDDKEWAEEINDSPKGVGLSERDINLISKNIGPDKWKPLARHLKDDQSEFIFDEGLIAEIDSKHKTTELKLREVMTLFLERVDNSSARKELINVLTRIKRRDLAKIMEQS